MARWTGALSALVLVLVGLPASAGATEVEDEVGWSTIAALGRPAPEAATAVAGSVDAAAVAGTFEETTCFTELPAGAGEDDVRCGHVTVPADHADPAGPTIRLAVALRAATGGAAAPDPLLVLGGGPGEHLVTAFPALLADGGPFAAVNAERDVILLDQRGVGFSEPALDCPEVLAVAPGADDVLQAFLDAIAECRARLVAEGVDLDAYDTQNNVADLDVVRAALGYDTWNVFGTSYGARLALQAARELPATMRTMVLSSAIPAEENFVEDVGPSYERALDEVFAACAADAGCAGEFGDVEQTLEDVLMALVEEPVLVDVTDPTTGDVVSVPVTASDVASNLFTVFYISSAIPAIPALIDSMGDGDFRPLFALSLGMTGQLFSSQGMQLSFLCAEEVDRADREAIVDAASELSLAPRLLVTTSPIVGVPVFDLCELWDVEPADDITFTPVTTDVATLVVNGRFDQITPPAYGEAVAAAIPGAVLVEVPDGGHSPLLGMGACGVELLAAFVDDPGSTLDASCATDRTIQFLADLPPIPQARATTDACPPGAVPTDLYDDIAASVHRDAVNCITWWGLSNGRAPRTYAPGGVVTRAQMASFVARLIERTGGTLPDDPAPLFPDTVASAHAGDIHRLRAAGVVEGRADGSFGPSDPLTRAQMAGFLVRAYEHRVDSPLPAGEDHFPDDSASVHHDDINKAAAAGFTQGYSDGTFGPSDPLRRDAIASFLARVLDLLVEEGTTTPPNA